MRIRGEGSNDHGDLGGVPGMAIQAKDYVDLARAIRDGLEDAARQRDNAGLDWACAFIRRRGGRWVAVMDLPDWCSLYREAVFTEDLR